VIERDGKMWTVAEIDQLERERDDYKDRWQTLGRVSKNVIDRLRSENNGLLARACAHLRESTYLNPATGRDRHVTGFRAAADELERTFGEQETPMSNTTRPLGVHIDTPQGRYSAITDGRAVGFRFEQWEGGDPQYIFLNPDGGSVCVYLGASDDIHSYTAGEHFYHVAEKPKCPNCASTHVVKHTVNWVCHTCGKEFP
jgi:ribosomal protein S27AE